MQVQTPGNQVGAGSGCLGQTPVVAIGLDQRATDGETRKLFQQQAALAASAQAKLPHQLLIAGTASGGAADAGEEIAVRGHDGFDGIPRLSRVPQPPLEVPLRCKIRRKDY